MNFPLQVGMVGFDFTPPIHREFGAWGTTPILTEVDLPLLGRCVALRYDDRQLVWFGIDLCGENVPGTDRIRAPLAAALDLEPDQVIWSTSQTHSSPTLPGSSLPGGSSITKRGTFDKAYCEAELERFLDTCVAAARDAIERQQNARVRAGYGFCDSISYNTRFPMPAGGVKFSRHHGEGLQSGKFFDPTIGLVLFEDEQSRPLGVLFNFCCHPATMVNDKYVSPDWVGTAREVIEAAVDGAPAMFIQGFCGDVNCHHIFGTPAQAKRSGTRLGQAAVRALPNLVPVRATPLDFTWQTIEIACRPMYTPAELETAIARRRAFIDELEHDPAATWFDGINFPEQFSASQKVTGVNIQIKYLTEGLRILDAGEPVRTSLPFTLGAVRIGDVAAVLSHGENFTATGNEVRTRSPFVHTLICGDTNGLWGYLGDDAEIDRGGYETDSYWKMLYTDGFRLAPVKGSANRIIDTSLQLLEKLVGTGT